MIIQGTKKKHKKISFICDKTIPNLKLRFRFQNKIIRIKKRLKD